MLLPLLALLGQGVPSTDPRRTFVAGEKDAYVMLAPQTVAGALARAMVWTADGTALAVTRTAVEASAEDLAAAAYGGRPSSEAAARMRPRSEVVVWNARTRETKTVLSVSGVGTAIDEMQPLPGTDRLVFATVQRIPGLNGEPDWEVAGVSMLAAGTGTLVRLDEATRTLGGDSAVYDMVVVSDAKPVGALERRNDDGTALRVRFFGPRGTTGDWITVGSRMPVEFDAQGRPGYRVVQKGADGKRRSAFQRIDPLTGRATGLDPEAPALLPGQRGAEAETPALAATSTAGVARPASGAPTVLLAAKGGKPDESGIVTTDGTEPLLSPRLDAVAYLSQGSALVRPIVRVDRKAYEAALLAARKLVAIDHAKQVAIGLLIFASDNDDRLPNASEIDRIMPYLKDRGIFDSFTYTYSGGNAVDIDEPATTEIGYVSGPGGRAVAYADGHVKWIPDNP